MGDGCEIGTLWNVVADDGWDLADEQVLIASIYELLKG